MLQFTTCAFILSPLTFLWLEGLEASFPGVQSPETRSRSEERKKEVKKQDKQPRLNVVNTIAKILIDQILGGAWNTVLFIVTIGTLRGQDFDMIKEQLHNVCYNKIRILDEMVNTNRAGLLSHHDRGLQTMAPGLDP